MDTMRSRATLPGCFGVGATMPLPANEKAIVHVVDDDISLREALQGLFETVGLEALTYPSAGDYLSAKLADRPGCIVVDVHLPDMNGLDFQARLVQLGIPLPVVVMTGYGDSPMSVRAMERGAVDFLPKPFDDQDMLDAVMAAIERDRERRIIDGTMRGPPLP
jgi:FixJ family two-component response regulator